MHACLPWRGPWLGRRSAWSCSRSRRVTWPPTFTSVFDNAAEIHRPPRPTASARVRVSDFGADRAVVFYDRALPVWRAGDPGTHRPGQLARRTTVGALRGNL